MKFWKLVVSPTRDLTYFIFNPTDLQPCIGDSLQCAFRLVIFFKQWRFCYSFVIGILTLCILKNIKLAVFFMLCYID